MSNKVIIEDSRNKVGKHLLLNNDLNDMGYEVIRSKCLVGDYSYPINNGVSIDTKANIQEIIQNVIHDHERLVNEIELANKCGIKLIFLIEECEIEKPKDLLTWENPRKANNSKATDGKVLFKILKTMREKYNTDFIFCKPTQTAKKIIELLGGTQN